MFPDALCNFYVVLKREKKPYIPAEVFFFKYRWNVSYLAVQYKNYKYGHHSNTDLLETHIYVQAMWILACLMLRSSVIHVVRYS